MTANSGEGQAGIPMQAIASYKAPFVDLSDVTCEWISGRPVLQHVSVRVEAGKLLCVAGPVGSGKSTLLMAILRELEPVSGTVSSHGRIAYSSQEAWILSATLRENVLFGEPFDQAWYSQVVQACALDGDIEEMPDGDETEVRMYWWCVFTWTDSVVCACRLGSAG